MSGGYNLTVGHGAKQTKPLHGPQSGRQTRMVLAPKMADVVCAQNFFGRNRTEQDCDRRELIVLGEAPILQLS